MYLYLFEIQSINFIFLRKFRQFLRKNVRDILALLCFPIYIIDPVLLSSSFHVTTTVYPSFLT